MNKAEPKEIICEGFLLRNWRLSDIDSITRNANNKNVWINLKDSFPYPYTKEDANRWIRMTESFPLNSNFAIVVEGKAIGGIGARFQDDVYKYSAELGYWVGEKYWRRGIATEAVHRITGFLFENFDINRIFARVFDWNHSSIKVLEKNGFFLEGRLKNHVYKDGLFTDELIFGLLKDRN